MDVSGPTPSPATPTMATSTSRKRSREEAAAAPGSDDSSASRPAHDVVDVDVACISDDRPLPTNTAATGAPSSPEQSLHGSQSRGLGFAENNHMKNEGTGTGVAASSPSASFTMRTATSAVSPSPTVSGVDAAGIPVPGGTASAVDQSRLKQQPLDRYGMRTSADYKKEMAIKDAQIEDLEDRLRCLQCEVSGKDEQLSVLDDALGRTKSELSHYQSVMRQEMVRAAKQQRAEARRLLHQRHFELGQITTWPHNGREVWMEGNEMRHLIGELEELTVQRDEVEAQKKAANSTLKHFIRQERDREDSSPGPNSEFTDSIMDAQEALQLRTAELTAITTRIAEIKQRQAALENEKKAFLKEIRRIGDEDASEFLAKKTIGDASRYVLMHLLGKGGFSEVWKAFDVVQGCYVACKIHRVNPDWPLQTRQHYVRHAERELAIMQQLNHPRLVKLYHNFPLSDSMFVSVMEYSDGMDLDTYLKRYHTLKENDARLVLAQMVSGLRYLAQLPNRVIHYDLKPANILLCREDPNILEIKITDFGLSKIIGAASEGPSNNPSIELTSQGTGTYWYLPPECFQTSTTPRVSSKVDIWSVGVIFYQMLFGRRPFAEGESQRKIWQEKLIVSSARALRFPDTPKVSEEAKDVITQCLAYNESDRCDIYQLSQHPYLFRAAGRRVIKAKSVAPNSGMSASGSSPYSAQQTDPETQ